VRWLEWNTRTQPETGVVYGVGRDVTERRIATAELRALRRVATLVAGGVQPSELFAVVAEEVASVLGLPLVTVVRYEVDGTATRCATFSAEGLVFPAGDRWNLEGTHVLALVRDSSEPARIDGYSNPAVRDRCQRRLPLAVRRRSIGLPRRSGLASLAL
jgi:GAF domain-containing protein